MFGTSRLSDLAQNLRRALLRTLCQQVDVGKDLAALRIGTIRPGKTSRCSRHGQIFVAVGSP